MTVLISESVCIDCEGKSQCQRLKRLNITKTIRDENEELGLYKKKERKEEVFELVINRCSMKEQYEQRKRLGSDSVSNGGYIPLNVFYKNVL